MNVTPGYVFNDTETVTADKLNELGQPTIELEQADIDPFLPSLGENQAGLNYFRNGNFGEPYWTRGATPVACPVAADTSRADWWWCRPAGAGTVAYDRIAAGPDNRSLHSARLTGAPGITTVEFGQNIREHLGAALREPLVVTFQMYNNTGADVTPKIEVYTADSANNFSSVTLRHSADAGTPVPTANWQRFTFALDATLFTNMANGVRIAVKLPSGALSSGAKSVYFSQMKVERGTEATDFVVERDEVDEGTQLAETGAADQARNFLDNPSFEDARFLSRSLTLGFLLDEYGAEAWWCRPTGAAGCVYEPDPSRPSTLTGKSVRITGNTAVDAVDFGQSLELGLTAMLLRNAVFSIYVYNATGADFTPQIRIDTCDSDNSFNDVTNRRSQNGDTCVNAQWTRISYAFDGSTITDWSNGARLYVRIPSGSLDDAGKHVLFAQAKLELGTAATAYEPEKDFARSAVPHGWTENLLIVQGYSTGPVATQITADRALLEEPGGRAFMARNVNAAVDSTTTGPNGLDTGTTANNTWYHIWLISDGHETRGMLSLSDSAPTMPAGYTYKARVGIVFWLTLGFRAMCIRQNLMNAAPAKILDGTNNGGASATVLNAFDALLTVVAIPPTAIQMSGIFGRTDTPGNLFAGVAADNDNVGNGLVLVAETELAAAWKGLHCIGQFTVGLTTPQAAYYYTNAPTGDFTVTVSQFVLR